jgi:hypothetical protein
MESSNVVYEVKLLIFNFSRLFVQDGALRRPLYPCILPEFLITAMNRAKYNYAECN